MRAGAVLPALGAASIIFVVWFTWQACVGNDAGSGQSRRQSMIEAWVNIAIGMTINLCANFVLLPLVGATMTISNNLWLGCIYTAVSMLRQYTIRRWFNKGIHKLAVRVAGQGP